jgi:hypothetical protein
MCSITDVLASAETSSNSNFLDSDNGNDNDNKGGTSFTRLREMQHFYASATTSSKTSHAMMTLLIASPATSFHGHEGND